MTPREKLNEIQKEKGAIYGEWETHQNDLKIVSDLLVKAKSLWEKASDLEKSTRWTDNPEFRNAVNDISKLYNGLRKELMPPHHNLASASPEFSGSTIKIKYTTRLDEKYLEILISTTIPSPKTSTIVDETAKKMGAISTITKDMENHTQTSSLLIPKFNDQERFNNFVLKFLNDLHRERIISNDQLHNCRAQFLANQIQEVIELDIKSRLSKDQIALLEQRLVKCVSEDEKHIDVEALVKIADDVKQLVAKKSRLATQKFYRKVGGTDAGENRVAAVTSLADHFRALLDDQSEALNLLDVAMSKSEGRGIHEPRVLGIVKDFAFFKPQHEKENQIDSAPPTPRLPTPGGENKDT